MSPACAGPAAAEGGTPMGLSDDAPGAAAGGGLDGPEGARWNAEWLRVTLASIGDGVLSTDAGGRVRFMNGVAERLTGWGLSEALGRPVDEVMRLVNAQTREVVENPAARALREGRVVALSSRSLLVSRGGAESPIDDSAAPIRAADGSVIGCVLVFRDVSERYRSEEALRASEAFSREVLESSPDRVMVLDTEGRMLRMNANGLRAMEIDDFGPYAGRSWLELWAPGCHQEVEAALATALSGNTARFQCLSPTKKGSKRWWDCVLAPMYGAG
ncbi:MAG TPA: PAS domain-containing protein, partial [Phycisphaerales bacterium]|nr:PAS domain-containing protein [Phycisphaerales bacterium]